MSVHIKDLRSDGTYAGFSCCNYASGKKSRKNISTQIEETEKSLALVMFGERVLFLQMLRESQRIFGSLIFVGPEYVLTSDRM